MRKPCKTVQAVRVMQKNVQAVRVMQAVPHANVVQNRASCSTCKNRAKPCKLLNSCKNRAKPCKLFVSCKKTCKLFHMQKPCKTVQAVRVMQKRASCSTKTMQKPCKMRRVRSANPLNIHSPRVPCYMCYMCYISQGKPLNIHSPRVPCYMCYVCYISQGKPLNIHSPRVPCYMCFMCYMALYSIYSTDFARTVCRSRNSDLGGRAKSESRPRCAGWRLCRAGAAGLCRAAGASQPFAKKKSVLQSSHGRTGIFVTLVPPMSRKRGWASPFWASPYSLGEPSNEVGASHQTRLGRAIKRGWGEPSNEVGRAIKRGWASQY